MAENQGSPKIPLEMREQLVHRFYNGLSDALHALHEYQELENGKGYSFSIDFIKKGEVMLYGNPIVFCLNNEAKNND